MAVIKIFISSVQKEFAAERKALCSYIREDSLLGKFFKPFLFEELPAIDRIDKCEEKGLKTPEFHFDEDGQVIIGGKMSPLMSPPTRSHRESRISLRN